MFLVKTEGFPQRTLLGGEVVHVLLLSPVLLVPTLRFMTAYVTSGQVANTGILRFTSTVPNVEKHCGNVTVGCTHNDQAKHLVNSRPDFL